MELDRYDELTHTEEPQVRLPYLTRPLLVIGFAVVTIVATVAAFAIGSNLSTTGEAIEDAATVEIPVVAKIEQRVVAPTRTYPGVVTAGESISIPGFTPDGTFSQIVVSVNFNAGDALSFGIPLGEVSGRPIFALRSSLPLYRNLVESDRGADVVALQKALNAAGIKAPSSGVMDWDTLLAIRAMYDRAGYNPPGWPGMPYLDAREVIMIDAAEPQMLSVAAAGSELDAEHPFATIRLSPNFVRARVAVIDEAAFQPGTRVQLSGPGGYMASGLVSQVSGFRAATDSVPSAGYDVDVVFAEDAEKPPKETTPMTVSAIVDSEEVLAVPLIAIRQDAGGAYLLLAGDKSTDDPAHVAVSISSQADGWAGIVSSDPRIREGATVVIR